MKFHVVGLGKHPEIVSQWIWSTRFFGRPRKQKVSKCPRPCVFKAGKHIPAFVFCKPVEMNDDLSLHPGISIDIAIVSIIWCVEWNIISNIESLRTCPADQADHVVYSFIQWAKLIHDLKPPPNHPSIYDLWIYRISFDQNFLKITSRRRSQKRSISWSSYSSCRYGRARVRAWVRAQAHGRSLVRPSARTQAWTHMKACIQAPEHTCMHSRLQTLEPIHTNVSFKRTLKKIWDTVWWY